jgi:hypothetical protein
LVFKFGGKFIANSDDVRPAFRSDTLLQADQTAIFQSSLVRDVGPPVSGTIDQLDDMCLHHRRVPDVREHGGRTSNN